MSHKAEWKKGKKPAKVHLPGAGKHNRGLARLAAKASAAAVALLVLFAWGTAQPAGAQTFSTLHNFTGATSDGSNPYASLVLDSAGNLYGTTFGGGTATDGTVFKLDPSGTETVLHSFTGGSDGVYPVAGLVQDSAGNLYGTTYFGGSGGYGNVFKLAPSSTPGTYTEMVLHSFDYNDGGLPYAGLILDAAGNLYGTTYAGGSGGYGTVFKLAPSSTPGTYTETVLYSFTGVSGDGADPNATLVRDSAGNLYGTTYYGGSAQVGTVFKVTPSGTETVLYSFTGVSGDGADPYAGLIRDSAGNLYGTTYGGGSANDGTVFKITSSGTETVLHSFTGNDGALPYGGLVLDSAGNLYGTTATRGSGGYGNVFKLAPSSTPGTYTETVLHSFNGTDGGKNPQAGLILDSTGNLYGTTVDGGSGSWGTVFKIALTAPFSAFSAKLDITSGPPPGFQLKANFTQGSGAPAINPQTQPVTLTVGTYSVTLPAGSFTGTKKGTFVYQGTLNGVALQIRIAPTGTNSYQFQVDASGVDLSSLSDPVTVSLSIGQNTGTTQVTASF